MDNEILQTEELEEVEEVIQIDPPRFVVRTTLDVNMQLEATNAVQGKGFLIFSYLCMGLCACMMIAMIVLYFVQKNPTNLMMAALMALALAFLIYNKFSAPKKAMANWEASIERSFGSKSIHLVTEFYERSLIQTVEEDAENMSDSGYSEISEMKETENLFLLRCARRQWYFVEKKGFQFGSADSFRRFITERIGGK